MQRSCLRERRRAGAWLPLFGLTALLFSPLWAAACGSKDDGESGNGASTSDGAEGDGMPGLGGSDEPSEDSSGEPVNVPSTATAADAQDTLGAAPSAADDSSAEPPLSGGAVEVEDSEVIVDPNDEPVAAAECAREMYTGERINTNVYLLLDISGSMRQQVTIDSDTSQWDAVRDAIRGFIQAPESSGLTLAMNYYPIQEPHRECDQRGLCPGNVACIDRVCTLAFGFLDDTSHCDSDNDCPLQYTDEDGTVYPDNCTQPRHCERDVTAMCMADWQCGEGDVCVDEPVAMCPSANLCTVADYQAPDVPLASLPDASDAFLASLAAHEPDLFAVTPTHVALSGAFAEAQAWMAQDPNSQSVVILATDGAPFGCAPELEPDAAQGDFELAASIEALDAARAAGIATFVIGVLPDVTGLDLPADDQQKFEAQVEALSSNLDHLAEAGGSSMAYNVSVGDKTTEGFLDALSTIRGDVLPCEYAIPNPTSGSVALDLLNVEFTAGGASTPETFPKVEATGECGDDVAWYYGMDAKAEAATRVVLCPAACKAVNEAKEAEVAIVMGCKTVIRVR
jgi:hypothetical protein